MLFVPALCTTAWAQGALGPAFTYQGRLVDGGVLANGIYDIEFKLFDAPNAGSQVGFTTTANNVGVIDGIVTIELSFGPDAFGGMGRWLEIGIRPGASTGAYTVLTPRQSITAAPYSWFSARPVPSGAVMYFNLQTCPAGWSELQAARGRYVVGLQSDLPGATLASTIGTPIGVGESRAVGQHTHGITDPGHTHTDAGHRHGYEQAFPNSTNSGNSQAGFRHADTDLGFANIQSSLTGVSINPTGPAGTNAPYIVLLICQKD